MWITSSKNTKNKKRNGHSFKQLIQGQWKKMHQSLFCVVSLIYIEWWIEINCPEKH